MPVDSEKVKLSVELESDVHYFALENSLSAKLRLIAENRGMSAETLINLWLQEKVIKNVRVIKSGLRFRSKDINANERIRRDIKFCGRSGR